MNIFKHTFKRDICGDFVAYPDIERPGPNTGASFFVWLCEDTFFDICNLPEGYFDNLSEIEVSIDTVKGFNHLKLVHGGFSEKGSLIVGINDESIIFGLAAQELFKELFKEHGSPIYAEIIPTEFKYDEETL